MNLVRLSFIIGMTSLSGYSLTLGMNRPYVPAVESTCVIQYTVSKCMEKGGYYNEWYFLLALAAMIAAFVVVAIDLSRRVY